MFRLPLLGLIVIALAYVDPSNLLFPNQAAMGLENKGLELPSRDPRAKIEHARWSPRHSDMRRTPSNGPRDLRPGGATGTDILATTRPEFRSSHGLVIRRRADRPDAG